MIKGINSRKTLIIRAIIMALLHQRLDLHILNTGLHIINKPNRMSIKSKEIKTRNSDYRQSTKNLSQ